MMNLKKKSEVRNRQWEAVQVLEFYNILSISTSWWHKVCLLHSFMAQPQKRMINKHISQNASLTV